MENKKSKSYYVWLVWVFTLTLPPVVFGILVGIYHKSSPIEILQGLQLIIAFIGLSGYFSLPAFLVFYLSFFIFKKFNLNKVLSRLCMALTGAIVTFSTFYLLDSLFYTEYLKNDFQLFSYPGVYMVSVVFFSLIIPEGSKKTI